MKIFFTILIVPLFINSSSAQSAIYGKITDHNTGEALVYAPIILNQKDQFKAAASTDFAGYYSIPIETGVYDIKVTPSGYSDITIREVNIYHHQSTSLDIMLSKGDTSFIYTINDLPKKDSTHLASKKIRCIDIKYTDNIIVRSGRNSRMDYYIDGILITRSKALSSRYDSLIHQENYLQGTPAKFEIKKTKDGNTDISDPYGNFNSPYLK